MAGTRRRRGASQPGADRQAPRYSYRRVRTNRSTSDLAGQAVTQALRPEAAGLVAACLVEGRLPADVAGALNQALAGALGPLAHDLIARRLRPIGGLIPAEADDSAIEEIARRLTRA